MDKTANTVRSDNMRRIRCADTKPEMAVRRLIHSMGYRYRLHKHDLPGRPDLVFATRKKVIFVHGCFWHQHDACGSNRTPKSNRTYWGRKLRGNKKRDEAVRQELQRMGWRWLIIWECAIAKTSDLRQLVRRFLGPV